MTLNAAALAVAADAVETAITHMQLHSAASGPAWTTNVVGTRVAVTGKVGANNTITLSGAWTGLTANQPVGGVSYWSASTGGTNYGGQAITSGDTAANAAGAYNISVTETGSAT